MQDHPSQRASGASTPSSKAHVLCGQLLGLLPSRSLKGVGIARLALGLGELRMERVAVPLDVVGASLAVVYGESLRAPRGAAL
jgi:hypothetical protein